MEILNIKRTAYSAWWEKYEKDKAYTNKKVEKELFNLKENDILKIKIDNINDLDIVKEAFENIGEVI